ncbi:hypothetical protein MMC06_001424 [Schaereria dolodes]|nr:hypothetical protein [Schaereria dolodes]
MSWFWRGFQSAVFYYVSCAPCTKLNYRRKQRNDARRARAEKVAIEDAQPDSYRHPSPFSTNIYWREEITMGPGPPPKKGNRQKDKTGSRRELNFGGPGSSAGGSSADTTIVAGSGKDSEMDLKSVDGEGWNKRRYQRPDEALWGADMDDENARGSSIRLSRLRRPSTTKSGPYYVARNPAVNDLHPPIVSTQPTQKSETKWMLQPPPSAKIMEGKEKANRSRSGSGGSYGSSRKGVDNVGLGRQVSQRLIEEKVRRGEQAQHSELVISGARDSNTWIQKPEQTEVHGQRHDRDTLEMQPLDSPSRKSRPPPITISEDRADRIIRGDFGTPAGHGDSSVVQRPTLSTIISSAQITPIKPSVQPLTTTLNIRPPPSPTPSTSSLYVLQELVSPSSALNIFRATTPIKEAGVRLPPASQKEDDELQLPILESWFPDKGKGREWNFPIAEGRRACDVAARWSMDT